MSDKLKTDCRCDHCLIAYLQAEIAKNREDKAEPTEQEAFVADCDLYCEHGIPSGFCSVLSCGDPKPERDEIDRQWLRAIFALIERHGLDPALEIHTVTSHVLQERKK